MVIVLSFYYLKPQISYEIEVCQFVPDAFYIFMLMRYYEHVFDSLKAILLLNFPNESIHRIKHALPIMFLGTT